MRNLLRLGIVAALALAVGTLTQAGGEKGHGSDKDHVMVRPDAIKWGAAPPVLPSGARLAVLTGDPTKTGPYVIRVNLPDGYKVPPHWHPTDENVTVIQGTLMVGKGEKFDATTSEALPTGSFLRMPKEMRHFAWTKGETIIQVHGMGPFEFNYVNAADDPRKK
jgi:quercetin dioxygenase-like cupin family protein